MHATDELPAVAEPGLAMGRYRLGARLGAGGFGTVYAARDERLGRPVAVKVIPAGGAAPERAQREALAVARLDHDAIVALFDAGEEDGCRYLVSELVEGRTLAQLERDGELSDRDVLRIGLALADALAHAHDRGVIHRDVKPQNVIVPDSANSRRGAAKLTDFGVAHLAGEEALTHTGDIVGTLAYMAPEQAAGTAVDGRADVYALGLVLYEALAGVNPVSAGSPSATARRIGTVLPRLATRRPDLPGDLCAALDRTLAPDPEARGELDDLFDALADALPAVSDDGGQIAPHPLERGIPALPPAVGRLVAPAAAGGLAWAALAGLTPEPALAPPLAAAATAALVAVLPRIGWLLAAPAVGAPARVRARAPARRRAAAAGARRCSAAAAAGRRALVVGPGAGARARPARPGGRVSGARRARTALERAPRARRARGLVGRAGRAAVRASARLRRRAGHAGPLELRRRGRDRGRRCDRDRVRLRRAAAGARLGRGGAGPAVARARPLARRRRRRGRGVGCGHRRRDRDARHLAGRAGRSGRAARARGRRGGRRRRPRWPWPTPAVRRPRRPRSTHPDTARRQASILSGP